MIIYRNTKCITLLRASRASKPFQQNSMKANDPVEWANKRNAAIERSKQIRENRKSGIGEAANLTFTPQLNKKPSYLSNKPDSLDKLASEVVLTDDIFEQPLPGKKAYGETTKELPSPGSDALGKEIKKFSVDSNDKSKSLLDRSAAPIKSNASSIPKAKDVDDDAFMNMLRNDNNSNNKSDGRGWNDDVSTDGGFDAFKYGKKNDSNIPKLNRRTLSQPPAVQQVASRTDWNSDTEVNLYNPVPRIPATQEFMQDSTTIRHARSKLSLLKSKIRQSETNSANMRSQSLTRSGSNSLSSTANSDLDTQSISSFGNGRKTAPVPLGGGDEGSYTDSFNQSNGIAERERANRSQTQPQPPKQANYSSAYTDEFDDGYEHKKPQPVRNNKAPAQKTSQQQQQQYDQSPRGVKASQVSNRGSNAEDQYQFNHQQQGRGVAVTTRKQPQPPPPSQYDSDDDDNAAVANRGGHSNGGGFANNSSSSSYGGGEFDDGEEGGENLPQMECPDCHRKFNPIPFTKHVKICAKVFLQKRKTFDSQKMRIQDNPELVQILTKAQKEEKKAQKAAAAAALSSINRNNGSSGGGFDNVVAQRQPVKPGGQYAEQTPLIQGGKSTKGKQAVDALPTEEGGGAKWKQQSESFRAVLKAARAFSKAVATGAPLPPPIASAPDPSLIPCPHCNRRFNEKAAERHIPQCSNIMAKPSTLKKGAGGGGGINGTLSVKSAKGGNSSSSSKKY